MIVALVLFITLVLEVYASQNNSEIDWAFLREKVNGSEFNEKIVEGLYDYLKEHPDNEAVYNFTYELYQNSLAGEKEIIVSEVMEEEITIFNKTLPVGWNLISIPLILINKNISEILSSIEGSYKNALFYDGEWRSYSSDKMLSSLKEINETMGFWLYMNQSDELTITGTVVTSTEFNLRQGWNLISYPSLNESTFEHVFGEVNEPIVDIFSFENNEWKQNISIIKPGNGYWIKVDKDANWTFFNGQFKEKIIYPNAMAALGDSITQATNTEGNIFTGSKDYPQHSWSTGYDSGDIVDSHYERILIINNEILNKNHNDAVSGSVMFDLIGQAQIAAAQNPEYITILMGSNDACTNSLESMTNLTDFENYFRQGMDILTTNLPNTKIFVVSLPDIYLLYDVGIAKGCSWLWGIGDICQALTSSLNTEEDRLTFRQRVIEYNQILENVTLEYNQLYTSSVFGVQFTTSDVAWDCFHPSMQGQMKLANVTWNDSYFANS